MCCGRTQRGRWLVAGAGLFKTAGLQYRHSSSSSSGLQLLHLGRPNLCWVGLSSHTLLMWQEVLIVLEVLHTDTKSGKQVLVRKLAWSLLYFLALVNYVQLILLQEVATVICDLKKWYVIRLVVFSFPKSGVLPSVFFMFAGRRLWCFEVNTIYPFRVSQIYT